MNKRRILHRIRDTLTEVYGSVSGYKRKARDLGHRIDEQARRLGGRNDYLEDKVNQLGAENESLLQRIKRQEGEVLSAQKIRSEDAYKKERAKRNKRKAKAMLRRDSRKALVQSYQDIPIPTPTIVLNHLGNICYSSPNAIGLFGDTCRRGSIDNLIEGSEEEKLLVRNNLNNPLTALVYMLDGSGKKITVEVNVAPQTVTTTDYNTGDLGELRVGTVLSLQPLSSLKKIYRIIKGSNNPRTIIQESLREATSYNGEEGLDSQPNTT